VLVEEIKSLNSRPEPESGVNPADVEKQIEDALKAQEEKMEEQERVKTKKLYD
jgi:hypothetical protein